MEKEEESVLERNKKIQLDLESDELYYNSTKFSPRFHFFIFDDKIIIITTVLLFLTMPACELRCPHNLLFYFCFLYFLTN